MSTLSQFLLSALLLSGLAANAQLRNRDERFALNLNDTHFTGRNQTLFLKQELRKQYPRINFEMYDLLSVRLLAKSQFGRGMAELIIGGMPQARVNVPGTPRGFLSDSPASFASIDLMNYRQTDNGVWQVRFEGNIVVRQVIVYVASLRDDRPDRPGLGRLMIIPVGEETANKLILGMKTFEFFQRNVAMVMIEGLGGTVDVHTARLELSSGRSQRLPGLEGRLYQGQVRRAYVDSRDVRGVTISAVSPNLLGSRGRYGISVGVEGRRRY